MRVQRIAILPAVLGLMLLSPMASAEELDADALAQDLENQVQVCWRYPPPPYALVNVALKFDFTRDGHIAKPPVVTADPAGSPYAREWINAAINALYACAPYKHLQPVFYKYWRTATVTFDPYPLVTQLEPSRGLMQWGPVRVRASFDAKDGLPGEGRLARA
jgi:hypothetical protein